MAKKMDMSKIKLGSVDSFFSVKPEEVVYIDIARIHSFVNHPFQVKEDDDMAELVQSIRDNGVLEAAIVRTDKNGDYEMLSGHRRKKACEIAGLNQMPVRIVDVSDDEATVYMVDANLRREKIMPSEKAKAYRMKHDALKHQGKETGEVLSVEQISADSGDSASQIKRYIRLTYLSDNLLNMVDTEKIPFSIAVTLSFLDEKNQRDLFDLLEQGKPVPSGSVAETLKKKSQEGKLNKQIMVSILTGTYIEASDACFQKNELEAETLGTEDNETGYEDKELRSNLDQSEKKVKSDMFPSRADMKRAYHHFRREFDSKKSGKEVEEDLRDRYGKSHNGYCGSDINLNCSLRGIKIKHYPEITWHQFVSYIFENFIEANSVIDNESNNINLPTVQEDNTRKQPQHKEGDEDENQYMENTVNICADALKKAGYEIQEIDVDDGKIGVSYAGSYLSID